MILSLVATVKLNGTLFVSEYYSDPGLKISEAPTKYLQMVNADHNNNKYYKLTDNGDGTFEAEYGRNGVTEGTAFGKRTTTYPLYMFYIKFLEKVTKGYVDNSELLDETAKRVAGSSKVKHDPIQNGKIRKVIEYLCEVSAQIVEQNYQIAPVLVSGPMLDKAGEILRQLYSETEIESFNKKLLQLFTVLPRKMARVQNCLAKEKEEFGQILGNEQDLLDNMITQVKLSTNSTTRENKRTILDELGIMMKEGTQKDIEIVKSHLDCELAKKVKSVFVVDCKATSSRYENYVSEHQPPETKFLWHGSRNENWLSIMASGLSLNPNAVITGKMFGNGIYFAPKARKSWGYTSARGSYWVGGNSSTCYMGLFETAYGIPYYPDHRDQYGWNYNHDLWKKTHPDHHCLHAKAEKTGLRNDEIIFYDESQVNMKYLVEFEA